MSESHGSKTCHRCKQVKSQEEFATISRGRPGRFCKPCWEARLAGEVLPEKRCSRCGEVKPLEQFCRSSPAARKDRLQPTTWTYCRPCNTEVCRERSQARIRSGEATQDYKERYKTKRWEKLLKQYGVTREQYEEMEEAQGKQCAICGRQETATYKGVTCRLVVDHDHKTNKVRGLLCRSCNLAIGNFREDQDTMRKAIDYLRKAEILN